MKVIEHLMVLAVVAGSVLTVLSCESSDDDSARHDEGLPVVTADIENLHARPSQIYCPCNNMPGRELVFDLVVENSGKATRTVYAFVQATNDEVSPPERGLWPVAAVDSCLTRTGELNVTDYTRGTEVDVDGQESVTVSGNSILEPAVHYKGQLVEFRKLRIELWSSTGNRIFQKTLDRIQLEKFKVKSSPQVKRVYPDTFESKDNPVALCEEQADQCGAEPLHIQSMESLDLSFSDIHPHKLQSLNTLIALYEAWNKPEQAEKWRAELQQTLALKE